MLLCPSQATVPPSELLVWQRVNHFAEAKQLTRKDLLKRHLARFQVRGVLSPPPDSDPAACSSALMHKHTQGCLPGDRRRMQETSRHSDQHLYTRGRVRFGPSL